MYNTKHITVIKNGKISRKYYPDSTKLIHTTKDITVIINGNSKKITKNYSDATERMTQLLIKRIHVYQTPVINIS